MEIQEAVSFKKSMAHRVCRALPRARAAGIVLVLLGVPALGIIAAFSRFERHVLALDSSRPERTDALVVLAGDAEREAYAVWLLEQGVASLALSTGVDPHCLRAGESRETCRTGIRNTIDEALVMRRILMAGPTRHATVVTSRYHLLRAAVVFEIAFAGSGVELEFIGPPDSKGPSVRVMKTEWLKLVPSVGAVIIGRVAPKLYDRLMRYRYAPSHPRCKDSGKAMTLESCHRTRFS